MNSITINCLIGKTQYEHTIYVTKDKTQDTFLQIINLLDNLRLTNISISIEELSKQQTPSNIEEEKSTIKKEIEDINSFSRTLKP